MLKQAVKSKIKALDDYFYGDRLKSTLTLSQGVGKPANILDTHGKVRAIAKTDRMLDYINE